MHNVPICSAYFYWGVLGMFEYKLELFSENFQVLTAADLVL